MNSGRRLPIGAEVTDAGVHFRLWAPRHRRARVVVETGRATGEHPLEPEPNGYFSGRVAGVVAGDLYRFRLDEKDLLLDPASRFQPDGPRGPSQVVDPKAFAWTDTKWAGAGLRGQVLYELHVGTFTREGTWAAAERQLEVLADLGVTVIELIPVADFPGRFGWGYDGVCLFAPYRGYGTPDDMRRFVNRAHGLGLGVILDVVYNHLGPRGNVLAQYTPAYFTDRHTTDWGQAINFDGPESGPVREFYLANAGYWIDEFHLDGLRLDATQSIFDDSSDHILARIGQRVRQAARGRATLIINENEPQLAKIVRPVERGGYGLDGIWNDDFHHSAMVALTGRAEAYYSDHSGAPQEFISAAKYGYLLQGQRYAWQDQRRGTPALDLEPWQFVNFIQNHDQVANSGSGRRCHALSSPGRLRAVTALTLLCPGTPMLFQGQEFAASAPFFYFADHEPSTAAEVKQGRAEFLTQFRRLDHPGLADEIPDPADLTTFEDSKLDHSERDRGAHAAAFRLHKDLLALRRTDPAFSRQERRGVDGAVLGPNAFMLRFFAGDRADRLLLVNFGPDLYLDRAPEPLLAPPEGCRWKTLWSSEDRRYGGEGTPPAETLDGWHIMGEAAQVLAPELQPPHDEKATARATAQMKLRKHRERTRLTE
ncbi:malto-oligosyltrehalose trehalohydrolase [Frigoriglobus tundricola]|uniref:Malto-oligosyltrehalose trehalohydrolase n=1 Tax=Frigoriglobus tundricola TaxID=2774151 RepID=A0A6M5YXY2_9BACT|nr:malto-oligosyltrehalose trehalohydrolase [Frigoriglobus tundricola]QJW98091.1 retaining malto-oligosyltrehalose trehalohydrolase [Frigoriglobus tundricola]